ncbi:MAG: MATE family efflux transporter [Clostridia bacterium]|nr:MATE family efflux transporter [Clostridia bacterium]
MNKDLTVGSVRSVLWKFCIPLFASIIFQQFYNLADSFVAGKYIGEEALAAVGNSYEITLIYLAFAFGCNIGCSVVSAQYFGAKRYGELKTAVYTTFIASGIVCLTLMLIGFIFGDSLLHMINTPENVFRDSKLYLDIYVLGLLFVFFYNIATGIFSALGDSKTPFYFLAVSSVANIFADVVFVTVFKMGVAGVAWATFICQGISCVLAMAVVLKRLFCINTDEKVSLFSFPIFVKFSKIAAAGILQQSSISIGNIIIQGIINSFGSAVMAGYSASVKLNNLVITSFSTIGNGVSSFTAQNIGAEKNDRVREGLKEGRYMVWIIALPLFIAYCFFGKHLTSAFLNNPSAEAIHSGTMFLRIVSPFYFIVSVKLVADGILRGAGLMKEFMAGTITDLILRVILSYVISRYLGYIGIWLSWPIGWIVGCAISVTFYYKRIYKNQNQKL